MTDETDERVPELITGLVIAQIVLARELERKGILTQKEYGDALQKWISNQPLEKQGAHRYYPLHILIRRLRSEGSAVS